MEEEKNELLNLEEDTNLINTVKEKDNLTHVFNAFQAKRQILRVNALNDVQDALVAQMARRLQETPNNFNNNDIAMWMKTVQQTLDSAQNSVKSIDDVPAIVNQNNTQINVNVEDNLSRESREKIMDALQAILGSVENAGKEIVSYDDNEVQEGNSIEINLGDSDNYGNKEDSNT